MKIENTSPVNRLCATVHNLNSVKEHKQSSTSCQLSGMGQNNNQALEMHLRQRKIITRVHKVTLHN